MQEEKRQNEADIQMAAQQAQPVVQPVQPTPVQLIQQPVQQAQPAPVQPIQQPVQQVQPTQQPVQQVQPAPVQPIQQPVQQIQPAPIQQPVAESASDVAVSAVREVANHYKETYGDMRSMFKDEQQVHQNADETIRMALLAMTESIIKCALQPDGSTAGGADQWETSPEEPISPVKNRQQSKPHSRKHPKTS
jgi:hypothetical protein